MSWSRHVTAFPSPDREPPNPAGVDLEMTAHRQTHSWTGNTGVTRDVDDMIPH